MYIAAELIGWNETKAMLAQMDEEVRSKLLYGAIEDSLQPVVQQAQSNAPTADTRAAIKIVRIRRLPSGGAEGEVGIPNRSKGKAFVGRWFEKGTKLRFRKSTRDWWQNRATEKKKRTPTRRTDQKLPTGKMPAHPFLAPALQQRIGEVRQRFAAFIAAGVQKWNQLGSKRG